PGACSLGLTTATYWSDPIAATAVVALMVVPAATRTSRNVGPASVCVSGVVPARNVTVAFCCGNALICADDNGPGIPTPLPSTCTSPAGRGLLVGFTKSTVMRSTFGTHRSVVVSPGTTSLAPVPTVKTPSSANDSSAPRLPKFG